MSIKTKQGSRSCPVRKLLLFDDLQDFHGACLNTDTAGDALGSGIAFLQNHDLHGANFNTLAARNAQLLINHINAGLGILSDGAMLANLLALTALDAGHGLSAGTLCNDLDAGQVFIEFLKESVRASTDALQASHALYILFNSKLFHPDRNPLFLIFIYAIIIQRFQNSNGIF